MNKASELISDSLLGDSYTTISIGGRAYTVYPPTIKVLCRALSAFSKIGMDEEYNKLSVLAELPENVPHIIKGLSCLIVGDAKCWRWKAHYVGKVIKSGTLSELKACVDAITPLLGGEDFFVCAASLKSLSRIAAKEK